MHFTDSFVFIDIPASNPIFKSFLSRRRRGLDFWFLQGWLERRVGRGLKAGLLGIAGAFRSTAQTTAFTISTKLGFVKDDLRLGGPADGQGGHHFLKMPCPALLM